MVADSARHLSGQFGIDQVADIAQSPGELCTTGKELVRKNHRLGTHSVGSTDAKEITGLLDFFIERGQYRRKRSLYDVKRVSKLEGQSGVEHIRRGDAVMEEAPRLRWNLLGDAGTECEQVVAGQGLELMNPGHIDPDRVESHAGTGRSHPGRLQFRKEMEFHFQHALPAGRLTPNP